MRIGGIVCCAISASSVNAVDNGLRRLDDEGVSNWPAIGGDRQNEDQRIPQAKTVEGSWHARERMNWPLEPEPMPRQRHQHHVRKPHPELNSLRADRGRLTPGEAGPDLICNREIHDDHRAAEDQMKMRGDPGRVVDHRVEAIAHIDEAPLVADEL